MRFDFKIDAAIFDNDGTLTQEKVLYYATGGDKHTA